MCSFGGGAPQAQPYQDNSAQIIAQQNAAALAAQKQEDQNARYAGGVFSLLNGNTLFKGVTDQTALGGKSQTLGTAV